MLASSSDSSRFASNDNSSDSIGSRCSSASSGYHKCLTLNKAKSSMWEYFEFAAKIGDFAEKVKKKRRKVYCKLYPKKINY